MMYNTKLVQTLAFAYSHCPLSLETTKHFQTYINSLFAETNGKLNGPRIPNLQLSTPYRH